MKRSKKCYQLLVAAVLIILMITGCTKKMQSTNLYVFVAASLNNTMEEIKTDYETIHPDVRIIYNADSSGTLKTQILEGAQCDVFFSAAEKQMDELKEKGYVKEGTITKLLKNQIVLIKTKGKKTDVTGFDDITKASSLALAGEDVPVGQYARALFQNLGIYDQVMKMEINEGNNVTAVLTAVAEGSNEVGVVYGTDAASMPEQVEIIEEADQSMVKPAVYPIGLIKNPDADTMQEEAANDFKQYLTKDETVMKLFSDKGFQKYTE
ncbi:molybdate ABC transporter substrate-binding protein [Clostridium sp. E02]|uniref:molybdate ABC transporter substrate-binding protein n=1 Tax=Clostridium sp. E02 TaxID=2487134 RepID=UPI000F51CEF4|nr:molybdate ABC transporter substrate-binding protein [Clostridium sp. E02]